MKEVYKVKDFYLICIRDKEKYVFLEFLDIGVTNKDFIKNPANKYEFF